MSASLVGSEMCIRDRYNAATLPGSTFRRALLAINTSGAYLRSRVRHRRRKKRFQEPLSFRPSAPDRWT
eukprot:14507515-Alexandrium_andersonii.AAC.1